MREPEQTEALAPIEAEIYDRRFPDQDHRRRMELWRVIATYLQRHVPLDSMLLELGSGDGEFISNIVARERWATDIRERPATLPEDIRFIRCDGLSLLDAAPAGSFDRVFMSNYLEHLASGDAVLEQLTVTARLLKPGGRVIILQPNIALVGAAYWDFIDHKVPLTEHSLTEAVELAGMTPILTIRRFLPYTTKGRLPTSPRLAQLYLAVRPAWWLLGKQTLMVAEAPGS
jgi:SAM-dependent methyltransferase